MQEEVAPPFERWPEHLRELDDRQLTELACDYEWLTGKNQPEESRGAFHSRREAIISECERRGLHDVAAKCRRPVVGQAGG